MQETVQIYLYLSKFRLLHPAVISAHAERFINQTGVIYVYLLPT